MNASNREAVQVYPWMFQWNTVGRCSLTFWFWVSMAEDCKNKGRQVGHGKVVPLMWNCWGLIMKRYEKQNGRSCFSGAQVTWIDGLNILIIHACHACNVSSGQSTVGKGASDSKGEEQHQHSSCCWDSADENVKCWRPRVGLCFLALGWRNLVKDGQGQRILIVA